MTFPIIKQKIGEGIYAYGVQSYWDPKKKQSRQKHRYLGLWDKSTAQIIPKTAERDIKTTKSFAPSYLLDDYSCRRLSGFLERLSAKDAAVPSFYSSLIAGEDETLIFNIGWSMGAIAMVWISCSAADAEDMGRWRACHQWHKFLR